jgi:hypothetical protein
VSSIKNDGTASGLIITSDLAGVSNWNALTIGMWMKMSTEKSAAHILDMRQNSTAEQFVIFGHDSTNNIAHELFINDQLGGITSAGSLYEVGAEGLWQYVAIVCGAAGAGNAHVYEWDSSGTLLQHQTGTMVNYAAVPTTSHLALFYEVAFNSSGFPGSIKFPRIWSAALTEAELRQEIFSPTPKRTANLWGAWTFDGESDTADVSGNGHDWSPSGGSGLSTDADEPPMPAKGCAVTPVVGAPFGACRLFEGINVEDDGLTVTAWIKVQDVISGFFRTFIWASMSSGRFVFLGTDGSAYGAEFHDLYVQSPMFSGPATGYVIVDDVPDIGVWCGFALTFKQGDATSGGRAYDENGTALGSYLTNVSGVTTNETTSYIEIGTQTDFGNEFHCKIAQGRVWNRILSQVEIEAELASSMPVSTTGLISAWENDPAIDVSGSGNPFATSNLTISTLDWPPNYAAEEISYSVPGSCIYVLP